MPKARKKCSLENPRNAMVNNDAIGPIDGDLIAKWSPKRCSRESMKVTSLESGNIRGGHVILNKNGDGATIAFCFKNTSGRLYGVTVGHGFDVGAPVFVYLNNDPTETPEAGRFLHEMMEIGEIVSNDVETDSAVFEVTNESLKDRFDLLKLLPCAGLGDKQLTLPCPSLKPSFPTKNSKFVVYGAWTRGSVCIASSPQVDADSVGEYADYLIHDIGFSEESSDQKIATNNGDSGALYLDVSSGYPTAMHHAMIRYSWSTTDQPDEFTSYGVPLPLIMAKHPEQFDVKMFGHIETNENLNAGETNFSSRRRSMREVSAVQAVRRKATKSFSRQILSGAVLLH